MDERSEIHHQPISRKVDCATLIHPTSDLNLSKLLEQPTSRHIPHWARPLHFVVTGSTRLNQERN